MERDLNFTVTDGRRDDSVRVNGGISEYAEVRSRTAELFRRPGIRVTAALLCCLLWGSAFPCVKMGYEMLNITDTGSQILFAGYRFVLAGIFTFLAGCLIEKRALLPRKTALPAVAGQAMLQTALQYVFFYVGMAHTTGIKGSVINSSDVFFAMFAAHFLIRGERVTWRKMIGCIIGFAGVFSVNLQPGAWDSGFGFLGDGMIVLSSVMYGVSSVTLKLIADRETPMCITSWQLFLGGLLLTAAGFLTGGRIGGFQLSSVLLLFYMALLSTVAFSLWSMLLKYNQVGQVAIFGFSIPIFGSLLSALILGEKLLSLQNLAALALVSAGILVVNGVLPIKSGKYKS